jgi:hypothetical protein
VIIRPEAAQEQEYLIDEGAGRKLLRAILLALRAAKRVCTQNLK